MKSLIDYINESNQVELVSDGNEHGFEYVDLGLPSGTMWATCNVGAKKPEKSGLLFQFGHVDGYKYGDKDNKFVTTDDANELTTSGKEYNTKEILDTEDDAAHVNMGGKWMMPTKEQLEELCDNTKCAIVTVNGVKGMSLTSKINNKQLFIPFVGYWYDDSFELSGRKASIWTSQVYASKADYAYRAGYSTSGYTGVTIEYRSCAYSVRGVFKK